MDEKLKPLFTPWRIGNCEIKNRIVLTSMGGTDLFGWMEKNHFDKMGARFLMEAAKNNAGLVLPGCQPVSDLLIPALSLVHFFKHKFRIPLYALWLCFKGDPVLLFLTVAGPF